jgi:hypothetical protein
MNSSSDSEDEKKKPKKKKKIPKLPRHNIVIENADKDRGGWMETWNKPKGRSPANIPHSFRLLALGGCGRGKSNVMKQIFLATQCSARKFKKLYVVTGNLESKEWDDCEPTAIMDTMPDLELFDGSEKMCLIIDDFEFEKCGSEQMRKLTTIFRMISTHFNLSVMASYQSFFHTPSICRKVSNFFIIYKPISRQETDTIANRVGIDPEDLREMFKTVANGHFDHLDFDFTRDSPYKIRKNLYEKIEYNPD